MSLSRTLKKNKIMFEEQFNKKSNFFRKLPKKKYDGLKKLEEDKIELIIDKILGVGEFKRDYSVFANPQNNQRRNTENKELNKNIKYKIGDMLEKDFEKKRQNKRYYDLDYMENEAKNEYDNKSNNYINKNKYKTIITKYDTVQYNKDSTFLSSIGNNIIVSNSSFAQKNKK